MSYTKKKSTIMYRGRRRRAFMLTPEGTADNEERSVRIIDLANARNQNRRPTRPPSPPDDLGVLIGAGPGIKPEIIGLTNLGQEQGILDLQNRRHMPLDPNIPLDFKDVDEIAKRLFPENVERYENGYEGNKMVNSEDLREKPLDVASVGSDSQGEALSVPTHPINISLGNVKREIRLPIDPNKPSVDYGQILSPEKWEDLDDIPPDEGARQYHEYVVSEDGRLVPVLDTCVPEEGKQKPVATIDIRVGGKPPASEYAVLPRDTPNTGQLIDKDSIMEDCAEQWLKKTQFQRQEQQHVIKVYTLCPFLFARVQQRDCWISLANKVDLLAPSRESNIDDLGLEEFRKLELVEVAVDIIVVELWDAHRLRQVLELAKWAEKETTTVEMLLSQACLKAPIVDQWRQKVHEKVDRSVDKVQVLVAVLFALGTYYRHVTLLVEKNDNMLEKFNDLRKEAAIDKMGKEHRAGNDAFGNGNYLEAASCYTRGLQAGSHLNHYLYGNRAQAYIKVKRYPAAASDGKRCIVLQPDWNKGWYRFCEALYNMGHKHWAVQENERGIRCCTELGDLQLQKERFQETLKVNKSKLTTEQVLYTNHDGKQTAPNYAPGESSDGDDPPELVSDTSESSDSSSEEEEESEEPPARKEKVGDLTEIKKVVDMLNEYSNPYEQPHINGGRHSSTPPDIKPTPQKRILRENSHNTEKPKPKPVPQKEDLNKAPPISREEEERLKRKEEISNKMLQGSQAMEERCYSLASTHYKKVHGQLKQRPLVINGYTEEDLAVLKYALGCACVETRQLQEIEAGRKWFRSIITELPSLVFPLAYYGTGRAYYVENRFGEAVEPLRKGLSLVRGENRPQKQLMWPATNRVIMETVGSRLQECLEDFLDTCCYPPRPDATCRYPECTSHVRIQIYFTDLDFQGFVRVQCFAHCLVDFHVDCWKKLKSVSGERRSDKDLLNSDCFTPNCWAQIWKIDFYNSDGSILKTMERKNEKQKQQVKKPVLKMIPSSQKTIASRLSKKQLKFQRKREKREQLEAVTNEESIENEPTTASTSSTNNTEINEPADPSVPLVAASQTTLLKRHDSDDDLYKGASKMGKGKSKKSKKDKQIKTVKLGEFVGPQEEEEETAKQFSSPPSVSGAMGIDGFDDLLAYRKKPAVEKPVLDTENPFSVPPPLQRQVAEFEANYTAKQPKQQTNITKKPKKKKVPTATLR